MPSRMTKAARTKAISEQLGSLADELYETRNRLKNEPLRAPNAAVKTGMSRVFVNSLLLAQETLDFIASRGGVRRQELGLCMLRQFQRRVAEIIGEPEQFEDWNEMPVLLVGDVQLSEGAVVH